MAEVNLSRRRFFGVAGALGMVAAVRLDQAAAVVPAPAPPVETAPLEIPDALPLWHPCVDRTVVVYDAERRLLGWTTAPLAALQDNRFRADIMIVQRGGNPAWVEFNETSSGQTLYDGPLTLRPNIVDGPRVGDSLIVECAVGLA